MKQPSPHPGLSSEEAARRLVADGPNLLPTARRRMFAIVFEAMREPMFLLLLVAATLYLALGDLNEGLMLLFMVCVTIGLTLYQEGKTERALEALRDLSSPRALVMRDGRAVRVPGGDLVRGDLLLLSEGDRVAADAVLLNAANLRVDESLLTGESWAVGKRAGTDADVPGTPGGEDSPFVWSGTLVVEGGGLARVTSTGARSELGKIGGALLDTQSERSLLQRETARLVRVLAVSGVLLSLLVAGAHVVVRGDWLQAALGGIALSMSLLPEEFPVILTVFPAIGAWRLARVQVLTRRLPAIETLGSISVLCTDKTGTLTENRMKVVELHDGRRHVRLDGQETGALPDTLRVLASTASLASRKQAFDPMEIAFHQLAAQVGEGGTASDPVKEYALSSSLRAMSMVRAREPGCYSIAAKGAPEAIAALCRLDEAQWQALRKEINGMAARGLRVLAAARAEFRGTLLPVSQDGFAFEFLGLLALADPLRPEIPAAVNECRQAGIRVIMITGDYPATAATIARQAGLHDGPVLEGALLAGDELARLDDAQLQERLRATSVCARITPEQKLRIVQALKAGGEVVAMTGDGVNDAPALKAAHVGIAMGGRGTDVAREAAALVLLDDNFASIVRGIRLGRRIFANLRNAMSYVLAMHVPIAGISLLPALLGWPILLYPMHIAFLELIINPACSLAFENEAAEEDLMRRPPRDPRAPLLGVPMFMQPVLQGIGALLLLALGYLWAVGHVPEDQARAAGFTVVVMINLALIFSNLSHRRSALHALHSTNRVPVLVAVAALAFLAATLYVPALATAFRFASPSPAVFTGAMALGLGCLLWFEAVKFRAGEHVAVRAHPV